MHWVGSCNIICMNITVKIGYSYTIIYMLLDVSLTDFLSRIALGLAKWFVCCCSMGFSLKDVGWFSQSLFCWRKTPIFFMVKTHCQSLLCLDLVSFPVCWVTLSRRLHSWRCPSVNSSSFNLYKFQPFSLATILQGEPKDFDFSQGAERVMQVTTYNL